MWVREEMDEMEGVLFLWHSVMSTGTGACVPSALPKLSWAERGEAKSGTGK